MAAEDSIGDAVSAAAVEPGVVGGDQGETSAEPALVILCIEDNEANLRLLERIVARRPGVELISAMCGRAGIELARECRPGLVFLDLHLPDMHGSEVLAILRGEADLASVPVVIVSADATFTGIDALLAQGADAYLTKPVDVLGLLELIDRTIAAGPTAGADIAGPGV